MDRRTARNLLDHLTRDADRICEHFGLRYLSIEAERANVKRRYGICYSDGSIKIRLRHAITGAPLKYSSLVNTLCHELAHLRHFDHSPRFQAFYARLLAWSKGQAIYRPGGTTRRIAQRPPSPPAQPVGDSALRARGPVQLDLF